MIDSLNKAVIETHYFGGRNFEIYRARRPYSLENIRLKFFGDIAFVHG